MAQSVNTVFNIVTEAVNEWAAGEILSTKFLPKEALRIAESRKLLSTSVCAGVLPAFLSRVSDLNHAEMPNYSSQPKASK